PADPAPRPGINAQLYPETGLARSTPPSDQMGRERCRPSHPRGGKLQQAAPRDERQRPGTGAQQPSRGPDVRPDRQQSRLERYPAWEPAKRDLDRRARVNVVDLDVLIALSPLPRGNVHRLS